MPRLRPVKKKGWPSLPDEFTPEQIKEARRELGLSGSEMGRMLDINDPKTYRCYEMDADKGSHRKLPPRASRLIRAYLQGYRPDDWPQG